MPCMPTSYTLIQTVARSGRYATGYSRSTSFCVCVRISCTRLLGRLGCFIKHKHNVCLCGSLIHRFSQLCCSRGDMALYRQTCLDQPVSWKDAGPDSHIGQVFGTFKSNGRAIARVLMNQDVTILFSVFMAAVSKKKAFSKALTFLRAFMLWKRCIFPGQCAQSKASFPWGFIDPSDFCRLCHGVQIARCTIGVSRWRTIFDNAPCRHFGIQNHHAAS